ncbi:glycoside hydrolase family 15 protein [Paenibacillus rigui]|uniref:GH15-like domain-containing protein n=1 Tax=Paenibacillus rigui TaxID=554312 RepID=A0A229UT74_9BACL|nr:glycoside hydrolase family 15 protein [Paenibacillus rigui]OXM86089.1 hypothetical protein CF651_12790 [Paenibacillus rigui]
MNTSTGPELSYTDLFEISKQIIALNQHPSGGYVACPLFSNYAFSWLRDGSFIAYAMDRSGETESSELFHQWVRHVLERQQDHVNHLLGKKERGEWIAENEFLHTRYHLDGRDDDHSEWGHFQLDGYGAWLWGLTEHWRAQGKKAMPESYRTSVELTVRYLAAFWKLPNFDCWEERNDQVHPSTLACIYGGLKAIRTYGDYAYLDNVTDEIQQFLLRHAVHPDGGYFVKSIRPVSSDEARYDIGYEGVDASLLWLCQPFQVFPSEHPAMAATLEKIQEDLHADTGGVRRYASDEYYGGGEWILLTAWQGWVDTLRGKQAEARHALDWILRQADAIGRLPEQVPHTKAERDVYNHWVGRWGTPATPLLWSHAMYLVLYCQLHK